MVFSNFAYPNFYNKKTNTHLHYRTGMMNGLHLLQQKWAPQLPLPSEGPSHAEGYPQSQCRWQQNIQVYSCRYLIPFKVGKKLISNPPLLENISSKTLDSAVCTSIISKSTLFYSNPGSKMLLKFFSL